MCGINLIISKRSSDGVATALEQANRAIRHRGPDDQSVFLWNNVGIGFVRLSIVDIAGGKQPFFNEDQTIVSVCNGEIYNFRSLRDGLITHGHHFRSESDCEVIVHLYEEYGDSFVEKLEGMFSFILLDQRKDRLIIGRDRLGIKPCFFLDTPEFFAASSEIKGLRALSPMPFELNRQGIQDAFVFGYIPGRQTAFNNVHHISPASLLKYELKTNTFSEQEYWQPSFLPLSNQMGLGKLGQFCDDYRQSLTNAVESHLMGEVPMSCYLSGGLDSSIVATLLSRTSSLVKETLRSYSIAFSDPQYDESAVFTETTKQLGISSQVVRVEQSDGLEFLSSVYNIEQPVFTPLDIPFQRLSASVRAEGRKVALVGEGSDELLGGYLFFNLNIARQALSQPAVASLKNSLMPSVVKYFLGDSSFAQELISIYQENDSPVIDSFGTYPHYYPLWRTQAAHRQDLFGSDLSTSFGADSAMAGISRALKHEYSQASHFDRSVYLELKTRLPNYILSRADRNSMANSIELRLPFLDNQVIDLSLKTPNLYKMLGLKEKFILRRTFKNIVPQHVLKRRKFAYNAPGSWIWNNPDEVVLSLISESALRDSGIFDYRAVSNRLKSLASPDIAQDKVKLDQVLTDLTGVLSIQALEQAFCKHEVGHGERNLGKDKPLIAAG